MIKAQAVCLAAIALAGCGKPTGYAFLDEMLVRNYDEIVEFWQLGDRATSAVFPSCDPTTINRIVPNPYRRLGRGKRWDEQQAEIERLTVRMAEAGMVVPEAPPSSAIIECTAGQQTLSDVEMGQEIDRRLDRQLRIIERMRVVSATVLGRN